MLCWNIPGKTGLQFEWGMCREKMTHSGEIIQTNGINTAIVLFKIKKRKTRILAHDTEG